MESPIRKIKIFIFYWDLKYFFIGNQNFKLLTKMPKTLTSTEIKKLLKEKKLVIGTERTLKNLKLGRVDKVIVTSNCPEKLQKDIKYYAGLGKAEVIKVKYPNEELGIMCRKPFAISVLSMLKGTSK